MRFRTKCLCFVLTITCAILIAAQPSPNERWQKAEQQYKAGNFRDAYNVFRKLALDRNVDRKLAASSLKRGVECLSRLRLANEVDEFRESATTLHNDNWRVLRQAARSLRSVQHYGYIVAGEFRRGSHRGGGRLVYAYDRDRVRMLQLMDQALPLIKKDDAATADERFEFYYDFADFMLQGRGYQEAWRFQVLTDLSQLPDYEEGYRWRGQQAASADAEGNPVYHYQPESYEAAKTDGERWRWMLAESVRVAPRQRHRMQLNFASFLYQQFGVQTMRSYGFLFGRQADNEKKDESGPYAVSSLDENETIAKLATGIKRFQLPAEFNFIKIYQSVAAEAKNAYAEIALKMLSEIFENRQQYSKSAALWRENIKRFGKGGNDYKPKRLHQIVGNVGQFENATVHPAGKGAEIDFRFRNGNRVTFEAFRIDVAKLLNDVKAYLKSNPKRVDRKKTNIANIGYRLIRYGEDQYIGERIANWTVDLKPRENHFDRRTTITTPLQKAGAYLLTGKMDDGNISRIIIWVSDTAIVKKRLNNQEYYFICDAVTGRPIPKANVEFFGFQSKRIGKNQYQVTTSNFAEFTDKDGQVIVAQGDPKERRSWVAIARTDDGRLAYHGFSGIWYGRRNDPDYNQVKSYVVTDRPVYRPKQKLEFKLWLRSVRYDKADESMYANRKVTIQISGPQGKSVQKQQYTTDEFGGCVGEYPIPEDAKLGNYSISIVDGDKLTGGKGISGRGRFRIEEYKKPEYEVTIDAPSKPVELGETITATIKAKYYFGAPVTNAKVHYTVRRSSHSQQWYPIGRWDWLYGSGYWWFANDYAWYPGWKGWGCRRPIAIWWRGSPAPPELVLDNEVEIGPDGTVKIEIDTAIAKELHGDIDHRYQITAEVVDESRRTIVGTGNVLVARKPFKVFTWLNRGYYRTGDAITANFKAQTLDRKPVQGDGKLTLYRVTYNDDQEPIETKVETWDLNTNDQGRATAKIKASRPGQYRLSYSVSDDAEHTIEGGQLFTVRGVGFDGSQFRFNDIELITEKREFRPGETVKLMINSNHVGATVALFLRPVNGVYLPPKIIRLDGKSTIHEVAVVQRDMPNFFIEALTVFNGKLASATREIVVPPEKRVINVDVQASSEEYQPGADADVKLKLTDSKGNPFVGSVALSVYDKSVEYISGGSNAADIKEFFWKWRRRHYPSSMTNLQRYFSNLLRSGETGLRNLGSFGHLVADQDRQLRQKQQVADSEQTAEGMSPMRARSSLSKSLSGFAFASEAFVGRKGEQAAQQLVQPDIRKQFADTAFWKGSITTDADGLAAVSFSMPDNLTTWKVRAWAMGHGTNVGQADTEVITTKNLLVRLQAPRFFVEKDHVVISANVHNYLDEEKEVVVEFNLKGNSLLPWSWKEPGVLNRYEPPFVRKNRVTIPAGGEKRVDWRVRVAKAGEAIVVVKALSDEESDAMEMRFPVYVHGMLKTESFTGVIDRNAESGFVEFKIPEERRIDDTRLEVHYSPTLAGAMVDALPYLVSYPYGCTEQTLNRFLPTVITQKVLQRMNVNLADIREKRTNLNAQEIGDDVERAKNWKRYDHNPVFDEVEVDRMVKRGVKDLTEMQLSDGGWGWFSGFGERSYPHTTALVVHGLQIAAQNDVAIVPGVLDRGVAWLKTYQSEQIRRLKNAPTQTKPYKLYASNMDAFVFMVLNDADQNNAEMLNFLYRDRAKLSVYAKSMFGLALHKLKDADKLAMVMKNIEQFLVQDDENQTAFLRENNAGYWWNWYGSDIEANAYYLKLLSATDPKGKTASRIVKYLLNNRRHATYWRSTRDTAICIEAMAEFLGASGESQPDLSLEILVDGKKHKEVRINAENLFTFDNKLVLQGDAVQSGAQTIEIRKKGNSPLYFNAYVTNFTLEDHIAAAGLEVKVNRKFYRLVKQDKSADVVGSQGQALKQKVKKYRREELENLSSVTSGDLIEVELEIDSKNDYEYLAFEDFKPSGCEPVDVRSGYNGNDMHAYVEFRDERVVFFVNRLARGKHSVSYRVRAEIPGQFSALPTRAFAMYAPELKANSDEIKIQIVD